MKLIYQRSITYAELKENPRRLVSFTNLTPDEFELFSPAFERTYLRKYSVLQTKTGNEWKRKTGASRKVLLAKIDEKLLFALVYQKSYPLQSLIGELVRTGQLQS
jgi:hypothetical protein